MKEAVKQRQNLIAFQATPEDRAALMAVANHLGLTASETSRRAMRLGLKVLRNIDVPGRSADDEHEAAR
jgi:hypothetical protein